MYTKAVMMGLVASANAFNAPMLQRPQTAALSLRMEAPAPDKAEEAVEAPPAPPPPPEYSDALPFLTRRASLGPKGALVGDVGFDPLGFTEILPLVRAAATLSPAPARAGGSRRGQTQRSGNRPRGSDGRCC